MIKDFIRTRYREYGNAYITTPTADDYFRLMDILELDGDFQWAPGFTPTKVFS